MPTPSKQPSSADPLPPIGPIDPGTSFAALDRALPLVLLPLRLEVRFWIASDPPELRVRIFPDAIHADAHQPELTSTEQALGRAYWRRCWRAGSAPPFTAAHDAAFAWLAGQVGPWRAAWIVRVTEPLNLDQAPAKPLRENAPLAPPPRFPKTVARTAGGPAYARLLPDQFALVIIDDGTVISTHWGKEIAADLPLAPGLVEAGDGVDGRALLDAQGLTWTYDFDAAVEAGMAIRVDFSTLPPEFLKRGFSQLLVLGVRTSDQQKELEALLTAHRYSDGLDFVEQGTPTNVTETAVPAVDLDHPDPAAVRAAELDDGKEQPAPPRGGGRGPKLPIPILNDDGDLYRQSAAAAATAAIGLSDDGALGRATNAGLAELRHAEAMAKALWPGLAGQYLDDLMQLGLGADDRAWLRDWSAHYVRGGGVLPTLLVGSQPYGLLPVSLIGTPAAPAGRIERLEQILGFLRSTWDDLWQQLPRLDPEAGNAPPGAGARAALVSEILGSVPHPTAFSLQRVDDERAVYTLRWNSSLLYVLFGAAAAPYSDGSLGKIGTFPSDWRDTSHDKEFDTVMWTSWLGLRSMLLDAVGPGDQLAALEVYRADLERLRDSPDYAAQRAFYDQWETYLRESMVAFVQAHADRTEPIEWLSGLQPGFTRMMGDDDDPTACFALYPSRADFTLPLVASGDTEDDVTELQQWLDALKSDLAAGRRPDHDFSAALPLLRQLLAWSAFEAAGGPDASSASDGLATLATLAHNTDDPVGELERLMREAVSTHANRIDAWYTAIAAEQLEDKRRAKPNGTLIGAYGWLEDVQPRPAGPSQGYILAPSPAHAVTAAILRSGWSGFGGDAESAGLAVDLSSDRIRRGRWLVDGVRNGQDLGALLGARLERRMQEAGIAAWIEDLRKAALRAAGSTAPPTSIVDGLLVARGRAYEEAPKDERDGYTTSEVAAAGELESLLANKKLSKNDHARLSDALAGGLDDLDAITDAVVAQSVFSLAEGNVPEATTMLTAASTGEPVFPPLRFADGRTSATTITHRLLLLVDPSAAGGWSGVEASGRALAAPGLEAWLEGALGDPTRYALVIRFQDPVTGAEAAPPLERTLADVGLAALDVIALAPAGEETGLGRLGSVLASWAEGQRPASLDPAATVELDTGGGDPSLDDLAVAGRALRALLDEARDLDARDLAAPGTTDSTSGLDSAELERRVDAVRAALAVADAALAAAVAAGADLRAPLLACSGFDLPGTVPRGSDPATLAAQAAALRAAVDRRLTELDDRVEKEADGWDQLDDDARYRALSERLELLVGRSLPLAPHFVAADSAGLDATFARPRLPSPAAATQWLAASGRVDPGARRLRVATDLVEALGGGGGIGFVVGQLPDYPGEGWVALSLPTTDDRGRLSLLAAGAAPSFAGAAAGLVLGAWTEVIPQVSRTAAVGLHFDSPAARPPQSLLLCIADADDGFSFELVCDQLLQTLELAKVRLAGPQTLGALGQYLPATYLNGAVPAVAS
jgi:hypothetical protein